MGKSQNPVLLLSDVERTALRKARIKVRDLGEWRPEDVVAATGGVLTLERAREHCALAAHFSVDGVGMGLATDFWKAGFAHPRELVGLGVQGVARRVEQVWNRSVDESYLRSLEAALASVERRYGPHASDLGADERPRAPAFDKRKLAPLPGGTRRAEIMKRPYVASLDEVMITRRGGAAIIEYAQEGVWRTQLHIGPDLALMSDADVLALFNGGIEASEEHRRTFDPPAIEIPAGKPQIAWSEQSGQWSARGHVLRCVVGDEEARMPRVIIDDKDLSWEQFGRLVASFAGWGMRIAFVADDDLDEEPYIEVRDRDER